jgi:AAA family ATP:ADP antiporter
MSTQTSDQKEFKGLRSILWPVYGYELKKFLPMAIMMCCILFNYTVLRNLKDTLVVNAPASGAEAIPFLKLWGVTPAAILFVILYAKLSNLLGKESLFYTIMVPFLIFFGAFAFCIYPNKDIIHSSLETMLMRQAEYPRLHWIIPLLGNWTFSVFYIMSELWGSAMLSLLFWQFANEITRKDEAKRFYPLFGLLSNFALMFSSTLANALAKIKIPEGADRWATTIKAQMTMIVIIGSICLFAYWWMYRKVLPDPKYYDGSKDKASGKSKPKLSIGESFKYIIKSKYIGYIAMLVLAYGVSINLCEGVWKGQIKAVFSDSSSHNAFMNKFTFWTGLFTVIMMVVGGNILRIFGWYTGAIITPIMTLITGLIFFSFILFRDSLSAPIAAIGSTPVLLAVIIGQIQNISTKAPKYSLFDPTKEMAYIPLDQELKVKGKAAVDVIGGRLGKSGGAFIQQMLLLAIPGATFVTIAPYVAVIFAVICLLWICAVRKLKVEYEVAVSKSEN